MVNTTLLRYVRSRFIKTVKPKLMQVPLETIESPKKNEKFLEQINERMCPFAKYDYQHQLKIKYRMIEKVIKKFSECTSNFKQLNFDSHLKSCYLTNTIESPQIYNYRNKDEFTIWPGPDGNPKTVGFLLGSPSKDKKVICVEPDNLIISKESHKLIAKKFQEYLRNVSPYDVCINFSKGGNWRRLVVRSNETGDHMVIAIIHPQDLSTKELDEEKNRIHSFFSPLAESLGIKSFYFQACPGVRCSPERSPFQLIFGSNYIYENLNGFKIRLSPGSFFQVNKKASEILYKIIVDELELDKSVTLLDLCCGTGVSSLHTASKVKKVIGIDFSSHSINDAWTNANLNGIKNIQFLEGFVEDWLPNVEHQLFGEDVAVIANPNRGGFRSSIITKLREMDCIKQIIFIACKPEGDALKNFVHLCLPFMPRDEILGSHYIPIKAIPVDLFPHTDHCELVFKFCRP